MRTPSLSLKFNLAVSLIWGVVFIAWAIALLTNIFAHIHWLDYNSLIESNHYSLGLKLFLFLLSWQVMIVGMMLPSSLPLVQLFALMSQKQSEKTFSVALLVLLLGYLTVWTGFALAAFWSALGLNFLFLDFPLLEEYPEIISSASLFLAGIFQFSKLKERCLKVCRHPVSFLHHHYQQGLKAAWHLGLNHGLYCLGCCWALMLVMFATGVGHLAVMLLLGAVMVIEKTSHWGQKFVPIVGVGFILWAIGIIIYYSV
ncbi:DUF2182 domain-containing protein [Gloeothece verrucosa]|uniref:Metal-binding integral membrane protein-like protein n=1 Tax=Gloeothece verrucosa (strain PCC 7822) TaxID=497965 RepID=E0UIU9_GLOV7|nr:DUF2182 domain-containing protein [Gloeothece verrucosa]ADN13408.1 Protein of unknown function DUF2182, transmembrane, metal-binding protein [Gloeothece verrucosa PCC 7822]